MSKVEVMTQQQATQQAVQPVLQQTLPPEMPRDVSPVSPLSLRLGPEVSGHASEISRPFSSAPMVMSPPLVEVQSRRPLRSPDGRRSGAVRSLLGALGLGLCLLSGFHSPALAEGKSPYAAEAAEIKTNLKAFPGLKKIAIVGVLEVLEDQRSGKQEFIYQKIPSQKLALRFSYFIPEGFTVLNRSAADVDSLLKNAGLGMGELLNFSQVPVLGQAYGADALMVGAYYSSTRNGFDVDIQSSVFVKLIDVKTGALVWTRELDKKELQVPGSYNRPSASNTPPGVRP